MLLKLFGHRETEDERFAAQGCDGARSRRPDQPAHPGLLRGHDAGAVARHRARLRRGRLPRDPGEPVGRHPARPRHAPAAAARPAPGPVQRAGGRDDGAGQLRPGLRGARPAVPDPGAARRRRAAAHGLDAWSSSTSRSATRGPRTCRSRRWRTSPVPSRATGERCSTTSRSGRVRADGRPGRPVRRRQDDGHPPGRAAVRRDLGRGPRRRAGRPRRDPAVPGGLRGLRDPGRPHVPRHDPREPPLRASRGRRRPDLGRPRGRPDRPAGPFAARRARHRRGRPRLPAVRRREAAARDRATVAQGAADRGPRRGDRPPRQRVRGRRPAGARRRAGRPHLPGDRPPALHGPRRRPDPRGRAAAGSCSAAPTPRCSPQGGLYADLYRTQFLPDVASVPGCRPPT